MRTAGDIYESIKTRFKTWTGKEFRAGTAIDFYNVAVAETMEVAHQEIENNRNPHIYTRLSGEELDALGFMQNCPRETGESDTMYLWRIMRWVKRTESSNISAVQDSLLNLPHAASAELVPFSHGCGTASVYVIPKIYDAANASLAIAEAEQAVKKSGAAGLYVEYLVPAIVGVRPVVIMETRNGDLTAIRSNIAEKFRAYINNIAPGEYMEIGVLEKLGMMESQVRYFSIAATYLNEIENKETSILQSLESKFLFDSITWVEE